MQKIYFPLMSNARWFTSQETYEALKRRIKMGLVLYDGLIFENGRYTCAISETCSSTLTLPPNLIKQDRSQIRFYEPGTEFTLAIGKSVDNLNPIGKGPAIAMYDVDFYPILSEGGLLQEEYIETIEYGLSNKGKHHIENPIREDCQNKKLFEKMTGHRFEKEKAIQSFYHDSSIAFEFLKTPMAIDPFIARFVELKNYQLVRRLELTLPIGVYRSLYHLGVPDFSKKSWEEIHKIRNSCACRELRAALSRICNSVLSNFVDLKTEQDIQDLIAMEYIKERTEELRKSHLTVDNVIVSTILNLIPFGCFVQFVADIFKLISQRRTWIDMIDENQSKSRGKG